MCSVNDKPVITMQIGIMDEEYVLLTPNGDMMKFTDSFIDVVREVVKCGYKIDEMMWEFVSSNS